MTADYTLERLSAPLIPPHTMPEKSRAARIDDSGSVRTSTRPGANRVADGVGLRFGVDERVGRAHLFEQMEVGVSDERLAVRVRPPDRPAIEIDEPRVHRVDFHGVEERGVLVERATSALGIG